MQDALAALDRFGIPVVIKADGLAAGKGVTVAMSRAEAEGAIRAAGDGPLVIEEFPEGEEASLFALVDGDAAVPLASAQDHKRVGEGDTGPNTGGMGAYAPAPVLAPELQSRAMDEIVRPTARALAAAGTPWGLGRSDDQAKGLVSPSEFHPSDPISPERDRTRRVLGPVESPWAGRESTPAER
jgi:phosphoribosylamine--glycine ligase